MPASKPHRLPIDTYVAGKRDMEISNNEKGRPTLTGAGGLSKSRQRLTP